MRAGEITAAQANVEKVRMGRVSLVTCRMPADVRKALNEAVKTGYLAHLPKDGYKPEAYFHPTFDYMAHGQRAQHADSQLRALAKASGVFARPSL